MVTSRALLLTSEHDVYGCVLFVVCCLRSPFSGIRSFMLAASLFGDTNAKCLAARDA
jgi:hypothetical protein